MAYGKKTGGKNIEKGEVKNPRGTPGISSERKAVRRMSFVEFIDSFYKYGQMSRGEIEEDLKRPGCTMMELMFGTVIVQAAKGDHLARCLIMDRLWGKVAQKHEIVGLEREKFDGIDDENLLRLVRDDQGAYLNAAHTNK